MKKILLILFLLPTILLAQNNDKDILPQIDGVIIYTGVVKVDSVKKDELFNRAKAWFVTEYKSANDVIQMEDKEAGIIIGKGFFDVFSDPITSHVNHTVKIYLKDGKYKYEITDFSTETVIAGESYKQKLTNKPPGNNPELYYKFLKEIDRSVVKEISRLEETMKKKISGEDF